MGGVWGSLLLCLLAPGLAASPSAGTGGAGWLQPGLCAPPWQVSECSLQGAWGGSCGWGGGCASLPWGASPEPSVLTVQWGAFRVL